MKGRAGPSVRALFPFRAAVDGLQDWGPLPVTVIAELLGIGLAAAEKGGAGDV